MQVQSRFQTSSGLERKKLFGLGLGLLMLDATSPGLAHNPPANAGWQPPLAGAAHAANPVAHSGWGQGTVDPG